MLCHDPHLPAGVVARLIDPALPEPHRFMPATRADITARRGRNIATVAVARRLLTLVYYGLRDGHIRALTPTEAKAAHDTAGAA